MLKMEITPDMVACLKRAHSLAQRAAFLQQSQAMLDFAIATHAAGRGAITQRDALAVAGSLLEQNVSRPLAVGDEFGVVVFDKPS